MVLDVHTGSTILRCYILSFYTLIHQHIHIKDLYVHNIIMYQYQATKICLHHAFVCVSTGLNCIIKCGNSFRSAIVEKANQTNLIELIKSDKPL